jgi:hypothetical protein
VHRVRTTLLSDDSAESSRAATIVAKGFHFGLRASPALCDGGEHS